MDELGRDAAVAEQMHHREKQLGIVVGAMQERLTPEARTALDYAALLPPDGIPWSWLRSLVERAHPDALQHDEGYPDPWLAVRGELNGLLAPTAHPEVARLHRLIGAHVAGQLAEPRAHELAADIDTLLADVASYLEESVAHETTSVWMLKPLQDAVLQRQAQPPNDALAMAAGVDLVQDDAVLDHIRDLFARRGRAMPSPRRAARTTRR